MRRLPYLALGIFAVQAPDSRPDSVTIESGTLRAAFDKLLPMTGRIALLLPEADRKLDGVSFKSEMPYVVPRTDAKKMLEQLLLTQGLALLPEVDGLYSTLCSLAATLNDPHTRSHIQTVEPSEIPASRNLNVPLALAVPLAHADASVVVESLRPRRGELQWEALGCTASAGPSYVIVICPGPALSVALEKVHRLDEEADLAAGKTIEDLRARVAALEAKLAEKPGTKPGR